MSAILPPDKRSMRSDIGKENDRLLEATRRTVLALLSGVNRQELAKIWREQLTETFKAELGALVWITGSQTAIAANPWLAS